MNALNRQQKSYLLDVARNSVAEELQPRHEPKKSPTGADLEYNAAAFVTLTKEGQLRGCNGSLEAHRPLVTDIKLNAKAAAFSDPRFLPVSEDELDELHFEVSVLTPPEKISFDSEADLFKKIRPLTDGIIIESGQNRATFLPQVWSKLPDKQDFFEYLKRKAGLASDFDVMRLTVYRYNVDSFEDS